MGISPNSQGTEAILNFPVSSNVHDIRVFIGLYAYFRKFIEKFSVIAKPLYDLLKKDVKFKFGERELQALNVLKEALTRAPILVLYNPYDETELHCDASTIGFSAILMQRKKDEKMHPIFYYSKRTIETESRYTSFELETLAIIYALRRFRVYLHGIKFKIITDCNSLTQVLKKKEINPWIERWVIELQSFEYTLEHRGQGGDRMGLSRSTNILTVQDNSFEYSLMICKIRARKSKRFVID